MLADASRALAKRIYEGANLRQERAIARSYDAQWRRRPLIGLGHNPMPTVRRCASVIAVEITC